jgi:hypothetical protein
MVLDAAWEVFCVRKPFDAPYPFANCPLLKIAIFASLLKPLVQHYAA